MQTTEFCRAFQRPPPVNSMGKYRRRFSRDKIGNTLAQTSIIYLLSPFISIIVLIISGLFMKIHIFINTTKYYKYHKFLTLLVIDYKFQPSYILL